MLLNKLQTEFLLLLKLACSTFAALQGALANPLGITDIEYFIVSSLCNHIGRNAHLLISKYLLTSFILSMMTR